MPIPLAECLDIKLDAGGEEPLYRQLYSEIRSRILEKKLIADQRLPSSRELAKSLKVSRNTVKWALTQLQAEGYLKAKVGSGVYVSAQIPDDYQQATPLATIKPNIASNIETPPLAHFALNSLQSPDPEPLSSKPFAPGMPDLDALPKNLWLKLWHQHLRQHSFSNISSNSPSGLLSLKKAICSYLRYSRSVNCKPEQIIITHGAQQALDLVCRILINPGEMAIVEEPGYLGVKRILQGLGAKLLTCPADEQGLNTTQLPLQIKQPIKLIYTTPTHQYPLGGTMPISRRLQLLEWANRCNTYIIEDDYDSEFHYTSRPLPSLQSLDKQQRVLYVGSFSKVLNPFLRLGYLVVPENLVHLLTKIKWLLDGHTEQVKQAVVAEFIEAGHFGRHLKRMRLLYANKMQCIVAQAIKQLETWCEIGMQGAGMHLVLTFKNQLDDQKVVDQLNKRGIAAKPLSSCYHGKSKKNGLILGFSHMQEEEIIHGMSVIQQCILIARSRNSRRTKLITQNHLSFTKSSNNE